MYAGWLHTSQVAQLAVFPLCNEAHLVTRTLRPHFCTAVPRWLSEPAGQYGFERARTQFLHSEHKPCLLLPSSRARRAYCTHADALFPPVWTALAVGGAFWTALPLPALIVLLFSALLFGIYVFGIVLAGAQAGGQL